MKKIFFLTAYIIGIIFISSFISNDDLANFVVKYKSEWGKTCLQCIESKGTYRVYFKNTYSDKLDIKIGVQEKDKKWRTFQRLNFSPNDTVVAYACKGTGKYMIWAKASDDSSTELPKDAEINLQYGK